MGFEFKGIDGLSDDLYKLAESLDESGKLVQDMLDAGADAAVDVWKDAITESGHIKTGAMLNSVGAKLPKNKNPLAREIYPQGTDKNGMRNAHKAYILNYGDGKRGRIAGDDFIGKAYEEMDAKVYAAEMQVYEDELKKRGF